MTYLTNRDYYLEVSRGKIAGHERKNKAGHNNDIDTATDPEDMWDAGGTWVAPTASRVHAIVSTSLLDTSSGTGARTVTIQGLNGSYVYTTETVSLNGVVPVNTVNSYTIIDYMFVATAGSLGEAQGTITATADVDLTVTAQINVGDNQTHMAIYQVPASTKGYLNKFAFGMTQTTAGSGCECHLMTKTDVGVWLVRRVVFLNNSGNSQQTVEMRPPLELQAKTTIKLQIFSVSASNTQVEGGFDLTLIAD